VLWLADITLIAILGVMTAFLVASLWDRTEILLRSLNKRTMSHQPSFLNRIARVLLCLVFVHAVIGKLTGFAGVAGAIAAKGLPLAPLLLVAAMALMAVGSALVISGWRARLGVVLLLLFLIPTTLIFHGDVADKMERIQLFKNLAIIGGLLLVADQDSKG
jgi:putative oxidoreductase